MKTELTHVIILFGTHNLLKHQIGGFIKNITHRFITYCLFKVKVLYSSYSNQQSEHGKLPLTPNDRIDIRDNGT